MFRRHLSDATIELLKSSPLWQNLCGDAQLYPEIRDDAITVYYRGGALLRELRVVDGRPVADVHHKYVPLKRSGASSSVRLEASPTGGLQFAEALDLLPLGLADPLVVRSYKDLMAQVLVGFPEGKLVQAICCRREAQVLDQEIAFQEPGESRDKIDLCHFDTGIGKLVFVEVKRKDDPRLFQHESRPEVLDQLHAYCRRLRDCWAELLAAYRQVVAWKRELGLGERLSQVPRDGPTDLLVKPVLVIGNCTDIDVRRIKNKEGEWAPLIAELKNVAAGLILCGKDGCRLDLEEKTHTINYKA